MKIKLLDFGYENPPIRAHYNDAGIDVYTTKTTTVHGHSTSKLPLGFGLEIPNGYMAMVVPRSGMSTKGLVSELAPIDSGYRGEIHAIISNLTPHAQSIPEGTRIAQLVIMPVIMAELSEEIGEERGEQGFGSTGTK